MALVTIHRSPSPTCRHLQDRNQESSNFDGDGDNTHKSKNHSESYLAVKGAALLILPQNECSRSRSSETSRGDIQVHLQLMLYLLRVQDKLKLAVKLESKNNISSSDQPLSSHPPGNIHSRYMILVSSHLEWPGTCSRQVIMESDVILGVNILGSKATIGLVLPVRGDCHLCLDGDGGFNISTNGRLHNFKPVSVQAMWAALQCLIKARDSVVHNSSQPTSSSSTTTSFDNWINYYNNNIKSEASFICDWHATLESSNRDEGLLSLGASAHRPEDLHLEKMIRTKLKQVMMTVDLEEVTSKYLREKLEDDLGISLSSWKRFIDDEMIIVMRQMDSPSEIFPYLYLGSEWNASNLDELRSNKVGYILNVTREIANFYPDTFEYHNIRIYDEEDSDLMRHWENTHKFISKARDNNSKVLVHCKMGVSRSASTVIAFVMKENKMNLIEATKFVKSRRSCIQPNKGFRKQLETYEGILDASKQRHSRLWQSSSSVNLQDTLTIPMNRSTGIIIKSSPGSNSSSSSSSSSSSTVSCDQLRVIEMDNSCKITNAGQTSTLKRTHCVSTSSDDANVFESNSMMPSSLGNNSTYYYDILLKSKSFLYSSSQGLHAPVGKSPFYSRSRSASPKSRLSRTSPDDFTTSKNSSKGSFGWTERFIKKPESFSARVRPDNFWIRDEPSNEKFQIEGCKSADNVVMDSIPGIKGLVTDSIPGIKGLVTDSIPGKVKRTKHEIENRERILSCSTISSRKNGCKSVTYGGILSSPQIHRSSSFKLERSKSKELQVEKRKTYPLSTVECNTPPEDELSRRPSKCDDPIKHSKSNVDIQSLVNCSCCNVLCEFMKNRQGFEGTKAQTSQQLSCNHQMSDVVQRPGINTPMSMPNSEHLSNSVGSQLQHSKCKQNLNFHETSNNQVSFGNKINRNPSSRTSLLMPRGQNDSECCCWQLTRSFNSGLRREKSVKTFGKELHKTCSMPSGKTLGMCHATKQEANGSALGDKFKSELRVSNGSKSISSLYLELRNDSPTSDKKCVVVVNDVDDSSRSKESKRKNLKPSHDLVFPNEINVGSKAIHAVCQKSTMKVKSPVIFMPSLTVVDHASSVEKVTIPSNEEVRRPRDLQIINLNVSKSSGDLSGFEQDEISRDKRFLSRIESSHFNICSVNTPVQRSICNVSVISSSLSPTKSVTTVHCKSLTKEEIADKSFGSPGLSCSKPPTPTYHVDQSLLCK